MKHNLVLLYVCSFGLFVTVGWQLQREVSQAQHLHREIIAEGKAMRTAVEGMNLKLGRYEQEYERRFLTMSQGCEAILSPEQQFRMDIVRRLNALTEQVEQREEE